MATFQGQSAIGASFAHRFGSALPFALTFGISHAGGKNTGAKVGIAGEF
jgi:trimeric autotransporter adhesin